jgi:quinol monooxygenase YgiN
MYSYLCEFHVRPELQGAFEKVYGPDGDWEKLFRNHEGYLGTILLRDRGDDLRYLTIDTWASRDHYFAFRSAKEPEFQAIDRVCQALIDDERDLGEYVQIG